MMNFKKCKPLAAYLLFTTALYGQLTPSAYIDKYADEYVVRLKDHCYTNIAIKKGEIVIDRNFSQKNLYLDKSSSSIGNTSLQYNPPFTYIDNIKAYSLIPKLDEDAYQKQKVKDITDKDVISENIFFGGNRAKIFTYSGLQKGAITVLEYTENVVEPKLVGSEIFQSFGKLEDQLFELTYDENINIDIKYFNCTENYFHHTVETKGGTIIHRWVPKVNEEFKSESDMPEYLSIMPHIVYRVVSYNYKGDSVNVLRGPEDLYAWYQSLMIDVNVDENDYINKITDSLIAGETSPRIKTQKIFEWVQSNIKYIAFEDGLGGFKPRLPTQVFEKRYGDCKDMSCLTVNMLRHANIPAYHTWIGTRRLPYTYSDVPSPLADNHMIVAVLLDSNIIFLDPTNSDLPFPLPSSFIQGKEAMIGISTDSFAIETVPFVSANENVVYDSTFITLDGLDLSGSGVRNYRGYYADNLNSKLHDNDQDELNDLLKYHVRKGNNKCISSGYNLKKETDRTLISYQFDVTGYAYQDGDQVFLNLNLEKVMSDYKIKDDRVYPVEYRFAYTMIRSFTIQIPEGYMVSHTPPPAEFSTDDFGFSLNYTQAGNTLSYHLEIDLKDLRIENDQFADWNTMIKELNKNYNSSIILTKL